MAKSTLAAPGVMPAHRAQPGRLSFNAVMGLMGGIFGMIVASVSPAFVKGLFSLKPEDGSIPRYAFSVGMIWGLFIGVGVSSFACLLTTIVRIIRLKIEHRSGSKN